MLLTLFMTPKTWKTVTISKRRTAVVSFGGLLMAGCLYFGVVQGLIRFELYGPARVLYSESTQVDIELLKVLEDPAQMDAVADEILERNPYVSVAYSAKSRYAYSRGDFAHVIEYKSKAINAAPFTRSEYVEYGYMLVNGIQLYEQAGDTKSANICKQELLAIGKALPALKERMSKFGASIETQPRLTYPSDLRDYIAQLESEG
jgi:tetratricopeptide (TPR) repeat protein